MLVFATLEGYTRTPDKLSLRQSSSLALTGLIWSRYSMVIIPVNYVLYSVNIALGLTGIVQVGRIFDYRIRQQGESIGNVLEW